MIGFYNILEACRHSYDNNEKGVEHLVYASSSSVYGTNKKVPYSTDDKVDNPVSLYAATKKSNELMAMHTANFTIFHLLVFVSSLYMDQPADRIWLTLDLQTNYSKEKPFKSSTMVPVTFADTSALERDYGFKPNTSLRTGLRYFAEWYKKFYYV